MQISQASIGGAGYQAPTVQQANAAANAQAAQAAVQTQDALYGLALAMEGLSQAAESMATGMGTYVDISV